MERRLFLQALVASVVAAGAPLPIGFPKEPKSKTQQDFVFHVQFVGEPGSDSERRFEEWAVRLKANQIAKAA